MPDPRQAKADAAREYLDLDRTIASDAEILEAVDGSLWEAFYDLGVASRDLGRSFMDAMPWWFQRLYGWRSDA